MNWIHSNRIISPDWLARPSTVVAPELLGCYLVRQFAEGKILRGKIVETEAYGPGDPACHAYRRRTLRNEVMFGAAGVAYVYIIYGIYHCFNVVTDVVETPSGVLIRALELEKIPPWLPDFLPQFSPSFLSNSSISNSPDSTTLETLDSVKIKGKLERLAAGPGKLCRVMAIDRTLNGTDLTKPPLWLEQGEPVPAIFQTTRIGLSLGAEIPWRWYIKNCQAVSKF